MKTTKVPHNKQKIQGKEKEAIDNSYSKYDDYLYRN